MLLQNAVTRDATAADCRNSAFKRQLLNRSDGAAYSPGVVSHRKAIAQPLSEQTAGWLFNLREGGRCTSRESVRAEIAHRQMHAPL
jgi:hypothetical protein